SYPNDHTNFDSTKVDMIKKNVSTAKDVVAVMGSPSGEYASPMVAPPVERALVYRYSQVQISIAPFTDPTVHSTTKEMIAGLDKNGVVVDVKYSSSQN
ncbi:MAG TPA: hypothetical protein VLE23_06300, partial [Geminicoccaceae bacterium]|nr:hypothetical protein [Geminicoccaceae bacterium]